MTATSNNGRTCCFTVLLVKSMYVTVNCNFVLPISPGSTENSSFRILEQGCTTLYQVKHITSTYIQYVHQVLTITECDLPLNSTSFQTLLSLSTILLSVYLLLSSIELTQTDLYNSKE